MNPADFLAHPRRLMHDGGPCPVPGDSKPAVLFRDGRVFAGVPAHHWIFPRIGHNPWSWKRQGPADIIAYIPEEDV